MGVYWAVMLGNVGEAFRLPLVRHWGFVDISDKFVSLRVRDGGAPRSGSKILIAASGSYTEIQQSVPYSLCAVRPIN